MTGAGPALGEMGAPTTVDTEGFLVAVRDRLEE